MRSAAGVIAADPAEKKGCRRFRIGRRDPPVEIVVTRRVEIVVTPGPE
jgi:hypothetical protein